MSTAANTSQANAETTSRRNILKILSYIFIAVALFVSGYLTYTKIANTSMICVEGSSIFNCELVENSAYAYILGIPTAFLGFLTYLVILALLILENRVAFLREYGLMILFGIVVFAFAYHCFLTYTAFFTLRALCPWCLTAHSMVTLLLIVTSIRLWRYFKTA
jgi:uncharacterized membrane protein